MEFFSQFVVLLLYAILLFQLLTEVGATLSKPTKRKIKKERRPDGIAYDNKNKPADCEVCRLVVDELESSLKKSDVVDDEEEKIRKRERRRKGKKSEENANKKIVEAIDEVCQTLGNYLPQNDLTKFRYVKRGVLSETAGLTAAANAPSDEQNVRKEFDTYVHPETKRLEDQCMRLIKKHRRDILKWNEINLNNSTSLMEYLCQKTVLKNDENLSNCLAKPTADDKLWAKTFGYLGKIYRAVQDEL